MRAQPTHYYLRDLVAATTTGTVLQNIKSLILQIGTLNIGQTGLEIDLFGTTAANANNKTLRVLLGTTVLLTTGAVAANNKDWHFNIKIYRTGALTYNAIVTGQFNGALFQCDTIVGATDNLSALQTINVEVTTPTAAGDLTVNGFIARDIA